MVGYRVIMALPSSQRDGESRFGHLLQPIRDLATNWDIDLASELEDYLAEVGLNTSRTRIFIIFTCT